MNGIPCVQNDNEVHTINSCLQPGVALVQRCVESLLPCLTSSPMFLLNVPQVFLPPCWGLACSTCLVLRACPLYFASRLARMFFIFCRELLQSSPQNVSRATFEKKGLPLRWMDCLFQRTFQPTYAHSNVCTNLQAVQQKACMNHLEIEQEWEVRMDTLWNSSARANTAC